MIGRDGERKTEIKKKTRERMSGRIREKKGERKERCQDDGAASKVLTLWYLRSDTLQSRQFLRFHSIGQHSAVWLLWLRLLYKVLRLLSNRKAVHDATTFMLHVKVLVLCSGHKSWDFLNLTFNEIQTRLLVTCSTCWWWSCTSSAPL